MRGTWGKGVRAAKRGAGQVASLARTAWVFSRLVVKRMPRCEAGLREIEKQVGCSALLRFFSRSAWIARIRP